MDGAEVFVDGSAEGVGRVIAYLAGRWRDRYDLVAVAGAGESDVAEAGFGDPGRER
jgi:hypothetical protein